MERCLRCGVEGQGYFCKRCGAILPPREEDYFVLFGLPRRFSLDEGQLKGRYYELSRLFHPDAHVSDPLELQEAALRWSALLNKAYQTLKDKVKRFRYLLSLEIGWDEEGAGALSLEHFELMERLQGALALPKEERRERLVGLMGEVEAEKGRIERELDELASRWDGLPGGTDRETWEAILKQIKAKLEELSYIQRMLTLIEEPEMASRFHL